MAGRLALRAALLLLLSAAVGAQLEVKVEGLTITPNKKAAAAGAGGSDATCKAGEPGCDAVDTADFPEEDPEQVEEPGCDALTDEQALRVKGCAQGSKYWRWATERFYSNDQAGARGFIETAYGKCLKKQKLTRSADCVRGWAEDVIQYRWHLEGPGVTEECKKEAQAKYTSGSKNVEECAQTYSEALESAEAEGDKGKLGKVYQDILQKCAGLSELCATQNGYMLGRTSKQAAAEADAAAGAGKGDDESKGNWGGLHKMLERRWKQQTDL